MPDGGLPTSPWIWIGWLGLACYFARFLLQWIASERAADSVTPTAFWWLSVAGALLLIAYTGWRGEPVFLFGYLVTLAIYARNLMLQHRRPAWGPLALATLAALAATLLVTLGLDTLRPGFGDSPAWLAVGGSGQALWSSRFVVQWVLSERAGHSHLPGPFWWISLAGNALLLAYAVHVGDPIWIAGLCPGPLVQIRNLMILRRRRKA